MIKTARSKQAFFFLALIACTLLLSGEAEAGVTVNTGEFVNLGRWAYTLEGGGTTQQPILWMKIGDSAYLSVYLVSKQAWGGDTWAGSNLKTWLDGTFLDMALSDGERSVLSGNEVSLPDDATSEALSAYGPAAYYAASANAPYWTRALQGGTPLHIDANGNLTNIGAASADPLGVRPLVSLDLSAVTYKSASTLTSIGNAGALDNPFILYPQETEPVQAPVSIDVMLSQMTLTFSRRVAHAYSGAAPGNTSLAEKFDILVGGNSVSADISDVNGLKAILTLPQPVAPGESLQVRYRPLGGADTDVLGFIDSVPALLSNFTGNEEGTVQATVKPYLTALSLSAGTLSPTFESAVFQYSASVANSISNVAVTPAAAGEVSISVNGTAASGAVNVPLQVGINNITVAVRDNADAANATSYTILLTRAAAPATPSTPSTPTNPTTPSGSLNGLLSGANAQSGGGAFASALQPGLYIQVLDGMIALSNPAGVQQFSAGQFGFVPTHNVPPVILPRNTAPMAPALAVNVPIGPGSGTTGNFLPVQIQTDLQSGVPALFTDWSTASDTMRTSMLNQQNAALALISQITKTVTTLVAAIQPRGGYERSEGAEPLTWEEALDSGIVFFTDEGPAYRYVLIDYEGEPIVAGDVLIVPDGLQDNQLDGSVWLLGDVTLLPQSISLEPSSLQIGAGESATVTASVTPEGATDKALLWTASNTAVASVEGTDSAGVYRVAGLSEGKATLTATASADRSVQRELVVTVVPASPPIGAGSSSGGGCDALSATVLAAIGLVLLLRTKRG